jgi:ComF family protein
MAVKFMAFQPLRLLRALLAQDCILCAAPSGDAPFCAGCADDMPALGEACPRCAGPGPGGAVCGQCLAAPPSFDATVALWRYAFPVDRLILALKYGGRLSLARAFGAALAARVAGRPVDAVVPMPLAPPRLRSRGFNQAMEIARALARESGATVLPDRVMRVRDTPPQADLPHDARAANVRGAFACSGLFTGQSLAVVDDVMTTGASLEALAATLKRAGAARVECWVVARALRD